MARTRLNLIRKYTTPAIVCASSLLIVGAIAGMPVAADAAPADSGKNGWVSTKKATKYYKGGTAVTGLQKIGKNRYFFNAKGVLETKVTKKNSVTYYPGIKGDGKLDAIKVSGTYYFGKNLKKMPKTDAYDFETYLKAQATLKKITKKTDSKSTKLYKAFRWVMKKEYALHRSYNPHAAGWYSAYARDHFNNKGGDCLSDAAALSYLAAAAGYKADVCVDTMMPSRSGGHSWMMIGKKVYDPLFAESSGFSKYYGVTSGTYETNPTKRFKAPYFSYEHAAKNAKTATAALKKANLKGLVKKGKNLYFYKKGKKVTKSWIKVGKSTYYFNAKGKAATGSVKIKGTYYIFKGDGKLATSSKASEVSVNGTPYLAAKDGKAKSGWNSSKTKRYMANGKLIKGVAVVNGSLYASDPKTGIYDAAVTARLKALCVKGKPAQDVKGVLDAFLGKPAISYSDSCNLALGDGEDGSWKYSTIEIQTFKPKDGSTETIWTFLNR